MNYKLVTIDLAAAAQFNGDAVVVIVDQPTTQSGTAPQSALEALLIDASASQALAFDTPSLLSSFAIPGVSAKHVVLASTGTGLKHDLSKAASLAITTVKKLRAKKVLVCFSTLQPESLLRLTNAIQSVASACYTYVDTKSVKTASSIVEVHIGVSQARLFKQQFDQATAIASGVQLSMQWANRPANYATPRMLSAAAQELAKHNNIHCEVLGPKDVKKLGMGCFAGVAQGSSEPLQLIVLRYTGQSNADHPTVLVGKGITFDSGGISIKPSAEMDEMKFDMCGAASVLGVFQGLAQLQPNINVVGLIPACENLPGPDAVKPGDVLTAMNGQTVEVLNTDAEGRLILCDTLVYAERFQPAAVIDIATLTGACVVALGSVRSALFSNDEALAASLVHAADASQDLCWRMPLDEAYALGLKSNFADVANVAGRSAGAVTAAKFLQRFVGKFPWAHLDIAGTAWKSGADKGATGRPVPLLLTYLLAQSTRRHNHDKKARLPAPLTKVKKK